MQPERVIAHEQKCRNRQLTNEEIRVLQAVDCLTPGGNKKRARAMRRALKAIQLIIDRI